MDLAASRRRASELSGGVSSEPIKSLILRVLDREKGGWQPARLRRGYRRAPRETAGARAVRSSRRRRSVPAAGVVAAGDRLASAGSQRRRGCRPPVRHGGLLGNDRAPGESPPRLPLAAPAAASRRAARAHDAEPGVDSLVRGLIFAGHFTHFLGACYPAHITALLRLDLTRLCAESGFTAPAFQFTDDGAVPKLTRVHWQQVSFGLLRGRLFSDNVCMVARAAADLSRV